MNFIYVIHLMCWNYLIAPMDLITHSRNTNNRSNSTHCSNKGARARSAHAPLLFPSPLLFLLFFLTKILTKKLTWAGQGRALGTIGPIFPRASPNTLL